jgi:hypothetical protein
MKELANCRFLFEIPLDPEDGGDKLNRKVDRLYQNAWCYNAEYRTFPDMELLRVKTEMFDCRYYVTWNNNNLSEGV